MKKNLLKTIVLFAIAPIFLTISCKHSDKKQPKPKQEFTQYVNAFTSGVISVKSPIVVELSQEQKVKAGDKAPDGLFEFDPEIKGTATWKNSFTLVFQPDKTLPSGTLYKAKFYLDKLMEVPKELKVFPFSFQTKTQAIDVHVFGIQAYDAKDLKWNKLEGEIKTADYVNERDLEKVLAAVQNAKELKISWIHFNDISTHQFTIDSIQRGDSQSKVIVQWNGKNIGADNKGEKVVAIPALNSFEIMEISTKNEPDQMVTIYFSDPLNTRQNLKGLIRFENRTPLRYKVSGNTLKVYPTRRINTTTNIILNKNIRNSKGKKLSQSIMASVTFTSLKPNIKSISKGVIMPNSKGLIFPFEAVNLKAVNVKIIKIFEHNVPQFFQVNRYDGNRELARVGRIVYKDQVNLTSNKSIDYGSWNTFALDLTDLIEVEPGAVYRVEMSFTKNQSLYNCSDDENDDTVSSNDFKNSEDKEYDGPQNNYYDDYYYEDYYYEDYNYRDRDKPCKNSYYYSNNRKIRQNILASNFGIIAKEGNNHNLEVFISDLRDLKNLSGVSVKIYDYQHNLLGESKTNSEGRAIMELPRKAFLLVAEKDGQYGYLRLDDGSSLSMSMFNVSGNKVRKGLKAYLFAERGIWRPGDSIYLNLILSDKDSKFPKNQPVVLEVFTPENQLFLKKVSPRPVGNFYDFRFATSPESPTGNWHARAKVGGTVFTKTLKIEAIKPNRLKINLELPGKIIHSSDNQIKLQSQWLHGAPASHLKAIVELAVKKGKTHFNNYADFHFDDPAKSVRNEETTLFDGKLDANGEAVIPLNVGVGEAPGMVNFSFKTRVFETGGDFSIDRYTVPYSPYTSYVGVKIPKGKGWNNALYSDETNLIPIVTVDENGNPVDRNNLLVEVYSISWQWWWQRSRNEDLGYYLQSSSSEKIISQTIDTKHGKAIFKLNFPKETWGRKFIRITDPVSGHSTGQVFYTDYKSWWNNPDNTIKGGAEMLAFNTDKQNYKVGEKVQIKLPVSSQGKALVSIENGSNVVDAFWVNVSKENHRISFETTADMAPNVYVHISYLQPHSQSENDRPIRLYGVNNIYVENPGSHLHPVIQMPEILRPEKKVNITVKEQNGKPMTYSVFMVDEGLLDLTRFKTPDPWHTFYAKEALGVKTFDMYNYVMGAFSGEIAGLLAIGGDEDLIKPGNKKANRFKPVVKFLGTFTLKKGQSKTHSFVMPNYIGSVRTMVVAGNQSGAYGSTEKTTAVKKPLMVLGTLPRVLGPQEQVKLPVTVFAMEPKIKDVKVRIKSNDLFQVKGSSTQKIHFDKTGEKVVFFDLEVPRKIGIATVNIEVSGNGEKATYPIELNVRVANPEITKVYEGVVQSQQTWQQNYNPVGITGTNTAVLEISSLPPINLKKRLDYLIRYPHGCIEQTTSSVFPQLYLPQLVELSAVKTAHIQDNIKQGLERLKQFQVADGGFSYWPGYSSEADDWGTSYACHFLLEAKAKGYKLPEGMLSKCLQYQIKKANNWTDNTQTKYSAYTKRLLQAYRLYTLSLAGKAQLGAMNRFKEIKDLSPTAKWRLIAAYYLAGQKQLAKNMMKNLPISVKHYIELYGTYGNDQRDEAMILETLSLMNEKEKAFTLLKKVASNLSNDWWMSTQTTAYSLLAVSKFAGINQPEKLQCRISYPKGNKTIKTAKTLVQIPLNFSGKNSQVQVTNTGKNMVYTRIINTGTPLESKDLAFSKNLQMQIDYFDINGQSIDIKNLKQGTDFVAQVTITHPGLLNEYKNMALTQIFPSGWEITNSRLDNIKRWKSDDFTYQDIRDDRVSTYFDLNRYKTKTFRFLLHAAYVGQYYLPSVKCEAMYDSNIMSVTNGEWVRINK